MSHRARFSAPEAGTALTVVDVTVVVRVSAEDTDGTFELFELAGAAGSGAPLSRHPWAETYYLLEGEADVQVGAQRHQLIPGATVTIPPNAAHSLVITSDRARMLVVSLGAEGVGSSPRWTVTWRCRTARRSSCRGSPTWPSGTRSPCWSGPRAEARSAGSARALSGVRVDPGRRSSALSESGDGWR